ncbi:MAG: hypothetical protein HKO13_04360 [Sphingomonas sp.]|nr:hypothetical protein [Sphingomonas sp.]
MAGQVRREPREPVTCVIKARGAGLRETKAKLEDITRLGCRLEMFSAVNVHDEIWVRLPNLEPLRAVVCWADKFQVGVEFNTPIHPAVFEHLLQSMKGSEG